MKYLKTITMLPLSFLLLMLLALPAMAGTHTIDGNLNDWGVHLDVAYSGTNSPYYHGTDDGWIPKGIPDASDIDFIVENNADTQWESHGMFYWADSKTGTHLQRTGTLPPTITGYKEGLIYCKNQYNRSYVQPAGGEAYDIEALYFDDDKDNVYLAIVTSVPPGGSSGWKVGDIAFDINSSIDGKVKDKDGNIISDSPYEYGIKVLTGNGINSGSIIYKPIWDQPRDDEFPYDQPYNITSGTPAGTVNKKIEYNGLYAPSDNDKPNYVIEVSIPKSKIGNPSKDQLIDLHVTIGCGNDLIELKPVRIKYNNVPEFPSIALPVAAIMGIMIIFGRRNKE